MFPVDLPPRPILSLVADNTGNPVALRSALLELHLGDLDAAWCQYLDALSIGSPERTEAALERVSRLFLTARAAIRSKRKGG